MQITFNWEVYTKDWKLANLLAILIEFSKQKLTLLGSQSVAPEVSRGAFDLSGTLLIFVAMEDADNGKECEPLFGSKGEQLSDDESFVLNNAVETTGNAGDCVTREWFGETMGWGLVALQGDRTQLFGEDGAGTNIVSMTLPCILLYT